MGTVHLAEDQKLGRKVAIKVLSREFMDSAERRERFQREARTAASISHPNVTGIFDIADAPDPDSGQPLFYIVMEYVQGEPLHKYLERKPDLATVLRIAEKIAAGMAAAHRLKILHRDIKPENVVITENNEPKILDFGLAKEIAPPLQGREVDKTVADAGAAVSYRDESLTEEGRIVGTVNYMSPEQARGEALDTRSDVFSFGILLYEMATGETPFEDASQVSVLAKIIQAEHQTASTKNGNIPPELDQVIDRCLRKNPQERYTDSQDLVSDLGVLRRQFESGVTESLSLSREALKPVPPGGARRWLVRAGLAAVAGVAVVLGIQFLGGDSGSDVDAAENRLAILGFENKTGDAELRWMTTGLPEILLTDLAQVGELSVIGQGRVNDLLKKTMDPEAAGHDDWVNTSRKMGASKVLSGSFYRLGDQIRIDARLEDTGSGTLLFAEKVVGPDPIALVDSLSAMVVAKMNMTRGEAGGMMTASAEAYRYYHEGTEKLLLGLEDEARDLFARSLAVDSTFALPYMRIGMSHVFEGRAQAGAEAFAKALTFKNKLAPRERALLDIYADVWLHQELGDAYTKMASFVESYPDDKEALSLYGALLVSFSADTTRGFAQFERALELDPSYPLAISIYANSLATFDHNERAIALFERYKEDYPDSPDAYEAVGVYAERLGDYDRALENYEEFRRRFPQDPSVVNDMAGLAIRQRDFQRARRYVDQIPIVKPNDLQWARNREGMLGNLDNWEGKFHSAMDHYRRHLSLARQIGDRTMIYSSLRVLCEYHRRFEDTDSSLVYLERSQKYGRPFDKMSYPVAVVEAYPERADEMRPVLQAAINEFKAHIPEDLWSLGDGTNKIFDAYAERDTAAIIEYYRELVQRPRNQRGPDTERSLGRYLTLTGNYEEALPHLEESLDTTSAWIYLSMTYWLGRALEGMGKGKEAGERYQEVLEYWDDADLEIEAIREAREGLARLSS